MAEDEFGKTLVARNYQYWYLHYTWDFFVVPLSCSSSFLVTENYCCVCVEASKIHRYHTDHPAMKKTVELTFSTTNLIFSVTKIFGKQDCTTTSLALHYEHPRTYV